MLMQVPYLEKTFKSVERATFPDVFGFQNISTVGS